MSIFNNIKNLFVVPEEENQTTNQSNNNDEGKINVPVNQGNKPSVNIPTTNQPPINRPVSGGFDQRIFDALVKALENANLAGFDFFEYRQSVKAMENIPMDEATRYRSAFATASTMGINLDMLLKSVQHYQGVLKGEYDNFQAALKGSMDNGIIAKENELAKMNEEIARKSEQIKQLTQEITALQENMSKVATSVQESKGKIEATRQNFETTYNSMIAQLSDEAAKMNQYLK